MNDEFKGEEYSLRCLIFQLENSDAQGNREMGAAFSEENRG
jgi:hypothetical protein